jgi:hypothetical protein
VTGVICQRNTNVNPTVGFFTASLNLFGRDRGHFVTCNRLFRVQETKRIETGVSIVHG